MDPRACRERLEGWIAATGRPLSALTASEGLALMTRLHAEDPTARVLFYAWGNVAWHGPEERGFRLCLEFGARRGDCQAAWNPELVLLFKAPSPGGAKDIPVSNWACADAGLLDAFRSAIQGSPPFQLWGRSRSAGVALLFFREGDRESHFPLVDWWGVRDPAHPIVSMTEEEWLRSDDVGLMPRWLRQEWSGAESDLDRLLYRYCLACCRRIWRLLPQPESRAAIETADRYLECLASEKEMKRAERRAEAAYAGFLHGFMDPEDLARCCEEISQMPPRALDALLNMPRPGDDISPRGLLKHAAYFADIACCYPTIRPKESIERFRLFLPAPLLREMVGNPFRREPAPTGS